MRRKGLGGFVGGSIHWIKGFFSPEYSVTSIAVTPPDSTLGVVSFISSYGVGSLSSITSDGIGVLNSLSASEGFTSIIQSRGNGVLSTIDETGQSVESEI